MTSFLTRSSTSSEVWAAALNANRLNRKINEVLIVFLNIRGAFVKFALNYKIMQYLLLEIPAPPSIIIPVLTLTGFIFPVCLLLIFESRRRKEIRNYKGLEITSNN